MDAFEVLARLAEHGTPPEADVALRMAVGLDDTLHRFESETLPFISKGGAEIRFCYGPYGRGKTHLLKAIQAQANNYGFVTDYIDCGAEYAPFASLADTYRMIAATALPPNNDDEAGIEAVISSSRNQRTSTDSLIRALRTEQRLELGFCNLVIEYLNALEAQNYDLIRTLGSLLTTTPKYHFTMKELYLTYKNLRKPIGKLSSRKAPLWIRSFCALPSALNYPGFVILFDETEKSYHMAKWNIRKRQQRLANIRNLVDHVATGMFSGCAFCFAVVEEFKEFAEKHLEALAQRIERVHPDTANPRAIWTSLDELTNPSPDQSHFFTILGDKIIELAKAAGMQESDADDLRKSFSDEAYAWAQDIRVGAVREFVKYAAAVTFRRLYKSPGEADA